MMHLRKKVFQGEIFLRYLAGYGLGRFVVQWFRTDKIFFPGTEIDVSLVISGILFVVCTVIVTVRCIMTRKRAAARMRRMEKDYQAEREAAEKRENTAEPVKTETVQGEKNEPEQDTAGNERTRRAALLQQLQKERSKMDSQIMSRSDLLKNLEISQRVDRILELYYES